MSEKELKKQDHEEMKEEGHQLELKEGYEQDEEYNGTIVRAAQIGHIPKSVNIDWNLNINDDGTFKSDDELSELYQIPKDSEIVTYCQGAYRAANSFLALKKLGFENVRVYLGSWGEWGNKLDLPVEK